MLAVIAVFGEVLFAQRHTDEGVQADVVAVSYLDALRDIGRALGVLPLGHALARDSELIGEALLAEAVLFSDELDVMSYHTLTVLLYARLYALAVLFIQNENSYLSETLRLLYHSLSLISTNFR